MTLQEQLKAAAERLAREAAANENGVVATIEVKATAVVTIGYDRPEHDTGPITPERVLEGIIGELRRQLQNPLNSPCDSIEVLETRDD